MSPIARSSSKKTKLNLNSSANELNSKTFAFKDWGSTKKVFL